MTRLQRDSQNWYSLFLCETSNRANKILNLCPIKHSSHCNCVRNKTNKLTVTLILPGGFFSLTPEEQEEVIGSENEIQKKKFWSINITLDWI